MITFEAWCITRAAETVIYVSMHELVQSVASLARLVCVLTQALHLGKSARGAACVEALGHPRRQPG